MIYHYFLLVFKTTSYHELSLIRELKKGFLKFQLRDYTKSQYRE